MTTLGFCLFAVYSGDGLQNFVPKLVLPLPKVMNKPIPKFPNITNVAPPKTINKPIRIVTKLPNGKCVNCFHWNLTEIIGPRLDLCSMPNKSQTIDLVIIIATKHENKARRALMREIYNASDWQNIRMIFVLGKHPAKNETEEKLLHAENVKHQDILQTSVRGSYWNMTRMVYGGYNWIHEQCKNAKFILKISDDTIINISGTLHLLHTKGNNQLHDVVFGNCNSGPASPVRGPTSHKWYVSVETYPFKMYPPYCSGAGFFMSFRTMRELLQEAGNVAFPNPHDDVFVGTNMKLSGHCPCQINGYTLFGHTGSRHIKVAKQTLADCKGIKALGPFMGGHFHGVSLTDMRIF